MLNHPILSYLIMVHNNLYIYMFGFYLLVFCWSVFLCDILSALAKTFLQFLFNFYFLRKILILSKIEQKVQTYTVLYIFPYTHCIHTCTHSPTVNIPTQSDIFVIINKLASTHSYHLKSTFYIRVHAWCYMKTYIQR